MPRFMRGIVLTLIAACCFPVAALAAEPSAATPWRVLPEGKLPDDSRLGPLKDLNGYFPFAPPQSREQWEKRADEVRRQILVATGLWPMPEKTPLNANVYGRVERDGYTVEKVYFESFPGHYVTGNLYRPTGRSGKLPGVLCPHGHWPDGRFQSMPLPGVKHQIDEGAERYEANGRCTLQAGAAQLARMGCIALIYDMEGYADSVQLPYAVAQFYALKRPEMDTAENWGFYSTQADLRLQSVMGLQTYNSIRALDFLCSLPDVDTTRIGVTGASSGGTQTLVLCAIDPRPTVAVPIVMVSTAMQGGCTCENCNLLRIGTGNVEFAALFAPKPQAAIGANDWTKETETKGGPELLQLYKVLGAPDNLLVKSYLQFPHNFNCVTREAMYAWMNRQLKLGLEEPIVEQEIVPLANEQLSVWDEQHPRPASGPDVERALLRTMTEDSQRQLSKLEPHDEKSLAEFRRVVGGAWEVMIGCRLPNHSDVNFKYLNTAPLGKYQLVMGLIRYAPSREEIPAVFLAKNPREGKRVAIWLHPDGKAGLFGEDGLPRPAVERLLDADVMVVGLDLFDQGEFLADGKAAIQPRRIPVRNNRDSAAYTFGYNPAIFAERVRDVLTAIAWFQVSAQSGNPVDVVGLNGTGKWAAAAKAIARDAVGKTIVDTAGFRFANLKSAYDPDFIPGGAKYLDLPGLLALSAPGKIWIYDSASQGGCPEIITATYKAAGGTNSLAWYDGAPENAEDAAVTWLLSK